jgi:hypothetical protein
VPLATDEERRRLDLPHAGCIEILPAAPIDEPRDDGAEAAVLADRVRHARDDDDPSVAEVPVKTGEVAEGILRVGAADEREHGHTGVR